VLVVDGDTVVKGRLDELLTMPMRPDQPIAAADDVPG
jgi:lipopolysaccharide biosynthesis glycosyltransferase